MKQRGVWLFWVILFLLCVLPLSALAGPGDNREQQQKANALKIVRYVLEKSSEDIQANASLWVEMRGKAEGYDNTAWLQALSTHIPSQPIGVIEVMHMANESPSQVCLPPEFADDEDTARWFKQSMSVLGSFSMADEALDELRLECLNVITEVAGNSIGRSYRR